ncbi:MAG: hypothetical protein WDN28_26830 [Chthoniobacter sp.]
MTTLETNPPTTREPAPPPGPAARRGFAFSDRRARYALHAICFGFFLVLLDTTALNVAIVAMQREFGGAIGGLQWVVNSYTVVFAGFLLTCGALGDRLAPGGSTSSGCCFSPACPACARCRRGSVS